MMDYFIAAVTVVGLLLTGFFVHLWFTHGEKEKTDCTSDDRDSKAETMRNRARPDEDDPWTVDPHGNIYKGESPFWTVDPEGNIYKDDPRSH